MATSKSEKEWEAEEDLRTLSRARDIQKDSKRMAAVRALAKKKMDGLKALTESK